MHTAIGRLTCATWCLTSVRVRMRLPTTCCWRVDRPAGMQHRGFRVQDFNHVPAQLLLHLAAGRLDVRHNAYTVDDSNHLSFEL